MPGAPYPGPGGGGRMGVSDRHIISLCLLPRHGRLMTGVSWRGSAPSRPNENAAPQGARRLASCYDRVAPVRPLGSGLAAAGVLLAELVHAAGGVHDLLLAGEERMAAGADFDLQVPAKGR